MTSSPPMPESTTRLSCEVIHILNCGEVRPSWPGVGTKRQWGDFGLVLAIFPTEVGFFMWY